MFEVWDRMGELDPRVRLHYIQPERSLFPWVPSLMTGWKFTHLTL